MRRFWVAVIALIACMAVGMATLSASVGAVGGDHSAQVAKKKKKKKKKFPATITLTITSVPPDTYSPGSSTYSGTISSGGPAACRSGRPVTISRNSSPIASTTTSGNGSYNITQNTAAAPGQYTASTPTIVVKKGKKKKKKKFVCLGATTTPVTVS
jgi:hypothetical protein